MGTRESFYCTLQFAQPGGDLYPIAVLLYDCRTRRLLTRFREDYGFATDEDAEVLALLETDLIQWAAQSEDPLALIDHLEEILSNTIRISERTRVTIDRDLSELLGEIYARHILDAKHD